MGTLVPCTGCCEVVVGGKGAIFTTPGHSRNDSLVTLSLKPWPGHVKKGKDKRLLL